MQVRGRVRRVESGVRLMVREDGQGYDEWTVSRESESRYCIWAQSPDGERRAAAQTVDNGRLEGAF